ncbi:6913_t:CDS:2, partial [Ambispora leptoticha]
HKTNPDNSSFCSHFTSESNENNKNKSNALTSFFNDILSSKPRVPDFKRDDYLCFSIVTLSDGSATYLGFLGNWFVLSQVILVKNKKTARGWFSGGGGSSSNSSSKGEELEMQKLENLAINEKDQAIKAKGACNYESAAKYYLSAAKRFQSIGGDYNQIEAAGCYENAYLAFQQTKQTAKALQALETAASIYEVHDKRANRAARVYEQLAELYKNKKSDQFDLEKALMMHQKAAELFEREDDGRHLFSLISQTELAAELGRYEEAIKILENVTATAANDRVLSFKYEELCQLYPSFADSRESKLIKKLIESKNAYDTSAFATACQEYDALTPFPPWQIEILLQTKKSLEVEDFR